MMETGLTASKIEIVLCPPSFMTLAMIPTVIGKN